jgi:hypothetical protein
MLRLQILEMVSPKGFAWHSLNRSALVGRERRRHLGHAAVNSHSFEASPLLADMHQALEAVRVASSACMRVQRTLQQDSINVKTDDSPVTIADYAAQAIVAWVLQKSCDGRCLLRLLSPCKCFVRSPRSLNGHTFKLDVGQPAAGSASSQKKHPRTC